MITPLYIQSQFMAIFKMFNKQPWEDHLDNSADGVFKSFWAILFSLPLVIIINALLLPLMKLHPNYPAINTIELPFLYATVLRCLIQIAAWALALFLLIGMAQNLKVGPKITPLIVSYNWSSLLLHVIYLLVVLVILPFQQPELLSVVALFMLSLWTVVRWRVIRSTTDIDVLPTIGILILLMLASTLTSSVLMQLGTAIYALFPQPELAQLATIFET